MQLIARAPYHPPAIRPLPAAPPPLPVVPKKTVGKKPMPQKPPTKTKADFLKPKPAVRPPLEKPTPPSLPDPPKPMPDPAAPVKASEALSTVDKDVQSVTDRFLPSAGAMSPAAGKRTKASPEKGTTPVAAVVKAAPRYDVNPPPVYPAIARQRGYEGTVVLEVYVGEDGQVSELHVVRSSKYRLLDRAAMKAVKRWQFQPGKRADQPLAMWVRVPINFRLQ
jgi:protein TonB